MAQSVARLTQEPEVSGSILGPATFDFPPADSGKAVVNYERKYVNEILINRLGGLRVGRKATEINSI